MGQPGTACRLPRPPRAVRARTPLSPPGRTRMRIAALIEISPTADGLLPLELIARAYRTSGRAPVVLVVADEIRDRVERVLDPLVPLMPRSIPGVRYISVADA